MDQALNEAKRNERLAEHYRTKYKDQVTALEHSTLNKVETVNEYHVTQLGKQLDSFETYSQICEANGTLNNLGQLPRLAFDVITATMGESILPIIASVQSIESQKGIVHFKNVVASNTKGNMTANETFIDPRNGTKSPNGYASNVTDNEVAGTGDGSTKAFTYTLAKLPSRSQFLYIGVEAEAGIQGKDVGVAEGASKDVGRIWGNGVSGTINYLTGELNLDFATAPGNGNDVYVSYQQNYEAAQDIPKIESYWDSKEIEARVYALKATVGILQQFTLQKQYGESAMDEMARDLIRAINMEIGGDLIRKLRVGASTTSTSFSKTAPAGVSFFEHKMTYLDSLYNADSTMVGAAGRGQISVMIVGREHAALVQSLPGFEKLSDGKSLGSHVFGKLNGITYIRVPEDNLIGDAKFGIGLFKGDTPFEAATVYSPFMPLTVTSDLPELPNPLVSQRAAACMAGVNVLVPEYATRFDITA